MQIIFAEQESIKITPSSEIHNIVKPSENNLLNGFK